MIIPPKKTNPPINNWLFLSTLPPPVLILLLFSKLPEKSLISWQMYLTVQGNNFCFTILSLVKCYAEFVMSSVITKQVGIDVIIYQYQNIVTRKFCKTTTKIYNYSLMMLLWTGVVLKTGRKFQWYFCCDYWSNIQLNTLT